MNTTELEPHQMPRAIVNWLYAEFMNGGDPTVLDELISPDYTGPTGQGSNAFKAAVLPLRRAFPDIEFEVQDMIVDDTRVAVRWTWQGTHRGTFANIAPTGRRITNEGIAIYRVIAGKIVESWAQMDRLGVLQQLKGERL